MLLEVQLTRELNWHRSPVHVSASLSSKNFALLHNFLLSTQYEIRQSKWSDTLKMKSESAEYFYVFDVHVTVQSSPVRGLDRPRGFQEVKVPRFRDNGTGWW